jgi:hypothetical protein
MGRWFSILRYRVWPEVRQTWPLVLFFVGAMVAYVLAVVAGYLLPLGLADAADQVRYFGTWLQLFGILLVAQGVSELRREFKRPTVVAWMRSRFAAIVQSFKRPDHTLFAGSGSITISGSDATLTVGRGRVTTDERLDPLEREIDHLQRQADEHERKVESKLSEVRAELSKEAQQRIEAHARTNAKLDGLAVGGLHLDVIGLWWLLFATVATSVPDGVVWFVHVVSAYIL